MVGGGNNSSIMGVLEDYSVVGVGIIRRKVLVKLDTIRVEGG